MKIICSGFGFARKSPGMLEKNRLEKLVTLLKRSVWLHAYNLQNFARRHFFDISEVSIVFHENKRERELELKAFLHKALQSFIKRLHVLKRTS